MIEVRGLWAKYGEFTLREVNLDLHEGGCLAILGPSGAGKTLLLETVMGASRPTRGCVMLDGRNINHLPPEARQIAYIPQDLALFPHLSVRDNITFGLRSRAVRRGADDEIDQLVAMLGIEHLMHRRNVATLSGGEKQRVALARALIVQPRVLFLDEPFAALDAATRSDLLRAMRDLRKSMGTTVFLVTHELDEACFLADNIAIIMNGRIAISGTKDDVMRQPRTTSVARFLNLRNILPIEVFDSMGLCGREHHSNGVTHIALRPEDMVIHLLNESPVGAPRAVLNDLIPLGNRVVAELMIDDKLRLEASLSQACAAAIKPALHREVAVSISSDRVIPLANDAVSA
ncbi:MAG TPA: ATP-binding cassette domain-containing protein [Phycisphaerales bacterium]|nr:ATP-binding cassette domain-containing protein [Phycisphaerales bacterium]HRQ75099.1 ATP-binding cassette domain-containing protein [Phycisphaerales bacterium]